MTCSNLDSSFKPQQKLVKQNQNFTAPLHVPSGTTAGCRHTPENRARMWCPAGQGVAGWYSLHPFLPFSTFRRGRANTLVAAAQPYAELGINEVTSSNRGRKMYEFLQHANEITGQEGISKIEEGTGQHYQDNALCERFGYSIQGCLLICGINQVRLKQASKIQ